MSNGFMKRWKRNNLLHTAAAGKVDCPACNGIGDCEHCDNGLMPLDLALSHPALSQITPKDIEQFQGRGR